MRNSVYIFLLLLPVLLKAQDIHFSQYQDHHALLNPALTGATGPYHAVAAYKTQWRKAAGEPYRTYGASFESSFFKGGFRRKKEVVPKTFRKQELPRLGVGISAYRDKSGAADFSSTLLNLSVATFVETGHWSFLSAGIQAGRAMRRMDQTNLIFPNQYQPGGYSSAMGSGEFVPLENYGFMDYAAGFLWSYSYTEKRFSDNSQKKFRIGASAYHLTQPKLRTTGLPAENLEMRVVVHSDATFSLAKTQLALNPSVLLQMQGQSREIIAGAMVKYFENNNSKYTGAVKASVMNFGLYYRSNDAIILQFLLEQKEAYAFGISYDLNISPLRKATRFRGGPELMVKLIPQSGYLRQKQ